MTDKELYFQLCTERRDIPLTLQAWWMNAVVGDNEWDVLLQKDDQGHVIAFLPYMLTRKYGFRIILQPNLSQTNGIWTIPGNVHTDETARFFLKKIEELRIDWFQQNFPFHFSEQQPFIRQGYQIQQRKTYLIHSLEKEQDELFQAIHSTQKRLIRKAEKRGTTLSERDDAKEFVQFHIHCLQSRGEKNHNNIHAEESLIQAAIDRGQGTLLYAINAAGEALAGLFLAWDDSSAYYIIPTYDYTHKATGASSYLTWEAILYAKKRGQKTFDFEGGNNEQIGRFYHQFGSEIQYYPQIEKVNSLWLKVYKRIKNF